ncbi:MAG: D-tyrosyl-tRNA(Tyr) deacylase [Lentimonas sp.]|jgi:D-tyrosyl-tRNA(Tyr) deacylase
MRALIQRVSEAEVVIDNKSYCSIKNGLLVFLGIESEDNEEDIEFLLKKITQLRIFGDEEGKMNLSLAETEGELLIISQFTLHASTKKGNRPSFIKAAKPEIAIPLYETFIKSANSLLGTQVKTGVFGADMKVRLINDGPVTIQIDSKNKE